MNIEKYIADKITQTSKGKSSISKPIVKIGILGIVLGLSVMLLTISIVLGFKSEITKKVTGLTADINVGNIMLGTNGEQIPVKISEDSLAIFRKLPNIKHIQGTAIKNGIVKTDVQNEGVLIKGIDKNYDTTFLAKQIIKGTLPQLSNADLFNQILISENLATNLELNVNDKFLVYFIVQREIVDSSTNTHFTKFEPRSRNFKISGIFKSSFSDFDNNLTFVDLRQIQKLNYWDSATVGNYEFLVSDFDKLDEVKGLLDENVGYNYQIASVKDTYSNIFIWLEKLDINGIIVIVLMILVAVINMITALLILILERTNMIGMLKSLGMNNASVRKIFLYISVRLLSKGLLWGNLVGIGLCFIQYYFKIIKLDSDTYYIDSVAIEINWLYYIGLNIGTTLVCLLMLFLPTLILTKITPIKTLRFD